MNRYTWLIEAGHGGMSPDGKYMTNGKDGKYFDHGEFTAYEGVTNRLIAARLMSKLAAAGILHAQIHHDYLDVPSLGYITRAVNNLASQKKCIYLSIHSDAISSKTYTTPGDKKAFGYSVFVAQNASPTSIEFANQLGIQLKDKIKEWSLRQEVPDRLYRMKNYWVLKNSTCPAALVELLFFDEINQAKFLNSSEGQERLAECLFRAILKTENP